MAAGSRKADIARRIVGLFVDQDRKRAELYALFAGRFPELRELWDGMAREGRSRAEYLLMLQGKMDDGDVTFVESRTRTYTLRSFIDYLDGIIAKTVQNRMTAAGALSIALDIERSNIGTKALDHFKGNSDGAEKFLRLLREEGADPRKTAERLRELLRKHRTKGTA